MNRAARPAFTLIELLVVISIVAVLIAILLPALGQARKATQVTSCLARLRGINQVLQVYLADNKQYFLFGQDARPPGGWQYPQTLNTYLNIVNTGIIDADQKWPAWKCPVIENDVQSATHTNGAFRAFGTFANNPNLMGWIGNSGYDPSGAYSLFTSGFTNVRETDLNSVPFGRLVTFMDGFKPSQYSTTNPCPIFVASQRAVAAPHFEQYSPRNYDFPGGSGGNGGDVIAAGGKASVAFLDGHGALTDPNQFAGGSGINSWTVRP